MSHFNFNLWH